MITAPFNFVPLSEKVFIPEWGEWVSHDIPFKDGESGEIEVTITAESPIFIRDHLDEKRFCNHNGQYYIPGSSLKGMVRSVLEIMSFGKMCPGEHEGNMDDVRFSVRDLSNAKNFYFSEIRSAKAGWLEKGEDGYRIISCGTPGRVSHADIDRFFGVSFKKNFKQGTFKEQNDDNKTARHKYSLLEELLDEKGDRRNITEPFSFEYERDDAGRKIYKFSKTGGEKGVLVMTGQPSGRKEPESGEESGKTYEFVFFEPGNNPTIIEVPKDKFEDFKFIYFDGRDTQPLESEDWKYWKKKLYRGERIPVFYHADGKRLKHFGLAYLYKLPYHHTTGDGVPLAHKTDRKDLAETIFGYVQERDALKGRVHFSHARAISGARELPEVSLILGTPRASFYPIYLRQNGQTYTTYMNDHFRLAGWKRYPVHQRVETGNIQQGNDNEEVVTRFKPLDSGVQFRAKIVYHNLKPQEIGALLSALTFHGCRECRHNIGLAKPFGYGKIRVDIEHPNKEKYLKIYEATMEYVIGDWRKSEQLGELLAMATPQNNRGNSKLKYMMLDPSQHIDEFRDAKKNQEYLKYYSYLDNIRVPDIPSYIDEVEMKSFIETWEKQKEEMKKRQEEYERLLKSELDKAISNTLSLSDKAVEKEQGDKDCKDFSKLQESLSELENILEDAKSHADYLKEKIFPRKKYEKYVEEYRGKAAEAMDAIGKSIAKVKGRLEYLEKVAGKSGKNKRATESSFENILEADGAKQLNRRLKEYLSDGKRLDDEELSKLKEHISAMYKKAKAKEKKKFFKDAQLARYLGREFEESVKKVAEN